MSHILQNSILKAVNISVLIYTDMFRNTVYEQNNIRFATVTSLLGFILLIELLEFL